jgi:uncharacterized protein
VTFDPIDVRDLVGHPGASRRLAVEGELDGLQVELATVTGPVRGELLLESVVEGILASGTITGSLRVRCARCLTEFDRTFEIELQELFSSEPDAGDDAYPVTPDGFLEPEPVLRDVVGVELPFAPLCRPDCRGLCGVCGENLNLDGCPGHEQSDPRWAALETLLLEPTAERER